MQQDHAGQVPPSPRRIKSAVAPKFGRRRRLCCFRRLDGVFRPCPCVAQLPERDITTDFRAYLGWQNFDLPSLTNNAVTANQLMDLARTNGRAVAAFERGHSFLERYFKKPGYLLHALGSVGSKILIIDLMHRPAAGLQ